MLPNCIISALDTRKLLRQGCQGFLAHVVDMRMEGAQLQGISVVCEFSDVFPEELPGLLPDREIEFTIEIIPGIAPISIAPSRMAPIKLKELKIQLRDLLDRGFRQPSVSL